MTDGLYQDLQPSNGQDDVGPPTRRRLPLESLADQEGAVRKALRLSLVMFLDRPSESLARCVASLSSELRQLRTDTELARRLAELETRLGLGRQP